LTVGFPPFKFGLAVVDLESKPSKTPAPDNIALNPPPLKATATFGIFDVEGAGIPAIFILFNHFEKALNPAALREEI